MTLELISYLSVFIAGMVTLFIPINRVMNFILFMAVAVFYSIVMRYSGWDWDINTYARAMTFDSLNNIYYYREPVYWFSANYLYNNIFGDEVKTFIFIDIISFVVIYIASRKLVLPNYFPFLFLIFFPALMGIQNVYRQYLSMSVLFLSIASMKKGEKIGLLYWIIACLTHNLSVLFLPILIYLNDKIPLRKLLFCLSLVSAILLIPIASSTKSHDATGLNLGIAYIGCVFMILFFVMGLNFTIRNESDITTKLVYVGFVLIMVVVNVIFLGPAQAERIGMVGLAMSLWVIIDSLHRYFKSHNFLSAIFMTMSIAPTFLFSSAFNMLLTSSR